MGEMSCCECGNEIVTVRGACFEITGFEEGRHEGGTHHVLWRKKTGRVMCPACAQRKKLGITADQMTLT